MYDSSYMKAPRTVKFTETEGRIAVATRGRRNRIYCLMGTKLQLGAMKESWR